jgi:hypothetical protein
VDKIGKYADRKGEGNSKKAVSISLLQWQKVFANSAGHVLDSEGICSWCVGDLAIYQNALLVPNVFNMVR